jgi:peptidoglycan/LPS O-acetylase OafA/YrhL
METIQVEIQNVTNRLEKGDGIISHIPALDALRGLAILLVLFIHFGANVDLPKYIHRLAYTGWIGVDLFLFFPIF